MSEEDYTEPETYEEETQETTSYQKGEGEAVLDKPIMDGFFSYETEIQNIQKTMQGFTPQEGVWVYTSQPLARDEFISNMINSIRSIVKQGSFLSSLDSDEVKNILMEKNYEFAGSVYSEPTIEDDDSEKIINMHDHMLELFLKTIENGLGNDTVRQMSTNIYDPRKEERREQVINWEGLGIKTR